jgi:SsrA-binding protein
MKVVAQNKKAFHEYDILDRWEAGIVLTGDEVKAIRAGHVTLLGAYATVHKNELFLLNATITPYSHAYTKSEEHAKRSRKLLLHRRELNKLMGEIARKGITAVPLKVYITQKGTIKVEIGLAKHKKAHGIKQELKERDIARETRRELKEKSRD